MSEAPRELMSAILKAVAERHEVSLADLKGPSRTRALVHARQEAMTETWRRTSLSKAEIGRRLGGRDHSTVIHGIRAHLARESRP